jgi:hypothetical protein
LFTLIIGLVSGILITIKQWTKILAIQFLFKKYNAVKPYSEELKLMKFRVKINDGIEMMASLFTMMMQIINNDRSHSWGWI